ncbi:Variant surface glycoprotein [Trypanosoma congolense IL3000]|uniref:Variant surface glycoprotein n=1 Tax=Trypanosoma congolense (strain IL3000) TaxID=1068625 RepID=F9W5Q0_TRYCI|nr:Variant surface glycoprotein [Trypanosoma congolense IL3000]
MKITVKFSVFVVMIVIMALRVQPHVDVETKSDDFDLLCNVTKVMLGLLDTVIDLGAHHDDIHEKESDISNKIDEIFFGSRCAAGTQGILILPEQFTKNLPSRKEVCGSTQTSTSEGMPTASESLATVFLCLCTPTSLDVKNLCELEVDAEGTWLDGGKQNIREVFEDVWDQGSEKGLMKRCVNSPTDVGLEEAKGSLTENIERLAIALKQKEILGERKPSCDGSTPCANITAYPIWFENLKKFEEYTKGIKVNRPLVHKESKPQISEITTTSPTPHATPPPTPPAPLHAPVSTQAHDEPQKQEARKSTADDPEQTTEPEPKKTHDTPAKLAEKTEELLPAPEPNETSTSIINTTTWPLLVALLI